MELRHLRYFVAVAEELNFRRAAERLNVAHPSLSRQIQDLEYELKARLLDRDTSGVRLTNAGTVFLEAARTTLQSAAHAAALAREAAAGKRGRLIVGNIGPFYVGLLAESVVAFRQQHSDVEVSLQDVELPDQLAGIEDGSLHLGFTMADEASIPAQFDHLLVVRSPICAMLGKGHPLVRKTRIKPADTVAETIVCLGAQTRYPGHAELALAAFAADGLPAPRIKRVGSFESLHAFVASLQGITFLPKLLARHQSGVVVRPIVDLKPDANFELRAVWLKQNASSLASQFADVLRSSRSATTG